MTTDFRNETFELATDSHLAERAKLGSAPAFDELVRRHADTAITTAMVVTGDAAAAIATGARAFTDVLDQMTTGGYSIDDPYLPGLIRSSREVSLADPSADPAVRERMDTRLPELARTTRWLTTAVALDAEDLALALDVDDSAVAGVVAWTDTAVADHAEAVDTVLSGVRVLVPTTFAVETRSIWRRWLATAGVEAHLGAARGVVAIESVASRILRGAAVVLIVAGAIGAATGIARRGDDGGGTNRIAQRAAVEQPMDRSQGSTPGIDGFDTSGAEQAITGTTLGPVTSAGMSTRPVAIAPGTNSQDVRMNPGSTSSPTSSGSSPAQPGMATAARSATGTPTSHARPGSNAATPTMPSAAAPAPTKPSATPPPATPPPAPTPPNTPPPATAPPVKAPPVVLPPITVPPLLAPVVGPATGALGGLLGGGR